MALTRYTPRKSTISPPSVLSRIKIGPNEDISAYIERFQIAIDHYHYNIRRGRSEYLLPSRQAEALIDALDRKGPYARLKKEYQDIYVNGRPNTELYSYNGRWFLTLSYLEKAMMEAKREYDRDFDFDSDPEEEETQSSHADNDN